MEIGMDIKNILIKDKNFKKLKLENWTLSVK
jgi:hypothetical protein